MPAGKKIIHPKYEDEKDRPERLHLKANESKHYVWLSKGLKPSEMANKKSVDECTLEKGMGKKINVLEYGMKRNQIEIRSMGDKPYKYPEYSANFFKDGGFIAGSTQIERLKAGANQKIIDFYTNIDLSKSVSPEAITWEQRLKMDRVADEKSAVNNLIEWEKTVLKESDPKYEDPDISNDEYVPKEKSSKKEAKKAKK